MEEQKADSFLHINIILSNDRLLYESVNRVNGHNNKTNGGVGLTNVRKRLEILYPNRHNLQILAEENEFKVMLELIL
jgi:LytS/YehU family sensor histidine kinase